MSNINIRQTGAILLTIGAVVSLIIAILGNDRFINLVFIFAIASTIVASTDKSSNSNSEKSTTIKATSNKSIVWISAITVIIGIIFALIN